MAQNARMQIELHSMERELPLLHFYWSEGRGRPAAVSLVPAALWSPETRWHIETRSFSSCVVRQFPDE
jgi:predicted class III extradiol MEMO1 family dioxygenase